MAYGQGSLQRRGEKWVARYHAPDGKQRSKSFDRKADARSFLASKQVDKDRGQWLDPAGAQIRFEDWAEEWFRGRHHLSNARRAADDSLYRNHVLPGFQRRPLGRISPLHVRGWANDLKAKGLSPRTIRACYGLLSAILRAAVTVRLIGESPIMPGVVDLPRPQRKRERFLTEDELETLVALLHPHYRPLVYAASYTGCRWQELAGLKRSYLDLDKHRLHVHGVFERDGGKVLYREYPKSEAGRRMISFPPYLTEILREVTRDQDPGDWVFTSREGCVLRESNFRRPWTKAVQAAGLSPLTFHDLRHTHAAWLIRDGVQPLALQRRLGHNDIRTTMNVYGHLFPNYEDNVVQILTERWEQARSGKNAKILSLKSRS